MRLVTLAQWLAIASIFAGAISIPGKLSFLNGNVILTMLALGCLVLARKLRMNLFAVGVLAAFLCHGILTVFLGLNELGELLSVLATTAIFLLAFQSVIDRGKNLTGCLSTYLRFAEFVSWAVIFQFCMYFVGVKFLYDYTWLFSTWVFVPGGTFGIRPSGVLYEPSQVGFTCALAQYIVIGSLLKVSPIQVSKRFSIVIIAAGLLSGSAIALFNLLAGAVILSLISVRRICLVLVLALLIINFLDLSVFEGIKTRVVGVYELYVQDIWDRSANASSYTIYAHFNVAKLNFLATNGLGSGMGSHILSFERFEHVLLHAHNILSISTAGNLFNRLISELGVIGLGLIAVYVMFCVKMYLRGQTNSILYFAALSVLPFLARNGTYAYYGLAFYITLMTMPISHAAVLQGIRHPKTI